MAPIVVGYFEQKQLAKLGYTFDSSDLSQFEAQCIFEIEAEISKFKEEEYKKQQKELDRKSKQRGRR